MASAPPLPERAEVIVVGGGVAGLSSAWQLAELGAEVLLLEAETLLASHSSARNAAIFLPLEESPQAIWLASRSRDLLDSRLGTGWVDATGVALVAAEEDSLDELRFAARQWGVFHERWGPSVLAGRLSHLDRNAAREGVYLPLGGVMDIELVLHRMQTWARRAGAQLATGARVVELLTDGPAVQGVRLESGACVEADQLVLAAGAWAADLARSAGCALPLTPLRRHLVHLTGPLSREVLRGPVVWRVDDPVYARPEAGGLLASPCDETPCAPGVPAVDDAELEALAGKLDRLAPGFSELGVHRAWACLRTFAPDQELVVGPDPRLAGLFWIAGLGGRGMSCGAAAGEMVARCAHGLGHPLAAQLAPSRLL